MFDIIGFEKLSFVNQETGESVTGTKFYLRGDAITKNGDGFICFSKFISSSRISGTVKAGGILEFQFTINSKGEARITGVVCS